MDIALLRTSFDAVRPHADDAAKAFYGTLLGTFPQVRPLFTNTEFTAQRKKLMASIAAVVNLVDKPDELLPALEKMGRSHVDYGVTKAMYPYVTFSLLHTLAGFFGDDWTAELSSTWGEALDVVCARMIEAQEAVTT
jgi:hemoglobin-like flavoprotein